MSVDQMSPSEPINDKETTMAKDDNVVAVSLGTKRSSAKAFDNKEDLVEVDDEESTSELNPLHSHDTTFVVLSFLADAEISKSSQVFPVGRS